MSLHQASLTPMADVMAEPFEAEPDNHLAFLSNLDCLQQALDRLQKRHRRSTRSANKCVRGYKQGSDTAATPLTSTPACKKWGEPLA